jgi:hypothetical protein
MVFKNQSPNLQSFTSSGYSSQSLSEIDTNYYYLNKIEANYIRTSTPTTFATSRSVLTSTSSTNNNNTLSQADNHAHKKQSSLERLNDSISKLKLKRFLVNFIIKCVNIFGCLGKTKTSDTMNDKFPPIGHKQQQPVYDDDEVYDNYNPYKTMYMNSFYDNGDRLDKRQQQQHHDNKYRHMSAYQLCETYAINNNYSYAYNPNDYDIDYDDDDLTNKTTQQHEPNKFPTIALNRNSTMINPNDLPDLTTTSNSFATSLQSNMDADVGKQTSKRFSLNGIIDQQQQVNVQTSVDYLSQYSTTSSITTLTRMSTENNGLVKLPLPTMHQRKPYHKSSTMKNLNGPLNGNYSHTPVTHTSLKYIDDDANDSILFSSSSSNLGTIGLNRTAGAFQVVNATRRVSEYPILKSIYDDYLCDREVEAYFDNPTYFDCYSTNNMSMGLKSSEKKIKIETYC